MKRRDFISKGLPGFAGAMVFPQMGCKGGADKGAEGGKKHKLVYRPPRLILALFDSCYSKAGG